ncbi:uncharacterized protein LOC111996913 [Quercus suber]|uniref:DUF4220 domain-containing protein n=1 Tax=Quercus suber TaxID=58331 RepID=A0AAW0JCT8_QUESU|nr:uncharacterized protein LOC111996913 [Quercus suber]POE70293.1 hypothetical protein CFP56_49637 [Quercus suber]
MLLPIPNFVKKLWYAWNLRSCILLSLWLQTILVLFAFLRKRTRRKLLHGLIWFAYLLADWIAPVAIGLISKSEGVGCDGKGNNKDIMAFWASFLLLHLGGPDTITSFALEDNEFWLRHLAGLILQVLATAYIFYQSLPNRLCVPTIMVFLVGTIKYVERTRALFLASMNQFGCSVLPKPDPGPDFEEVMKMRSSMTLEQVETQVYGMPSSEVENPKRSYSVHKTFANDSESKDKRRPLDDMQLLQEAHLLFDKFKGLIVGLHISSKVRERSQDIFLTISAAEAFRLIESELNFVYEYLHTKVVVVRCTFGYFLRFISFTLIVGALALFSIENQHEFHHVRKFDIILSYVLLVGALGLEAISFLMLILSDRTLLAVKGSRSKLVDEIFLKRSKWSKSVSQYDMISYCLNDPPTWVYTLANYVGASGVLEKMTILRFSHSKGVYKDLENFIFTELSLKSRNVKSIRAAMDASSQRGDWALLRTSSYFKLKWSIEEYQYAESLLIWHMATEILYAQETKSSTGIDNDNKSNRKICKLLSDYMFYLLVMKPKMMAPVLGNWQIVFQDTCAEAKRFFHKKSISKKAEACGKILEVVREYISDDSMGNESKPGYRSANLKGNVSKSVFIDGSILAKQLNDDKELKTDKWKLMSRVWVELMSYAAINCRPNVHAEQPSKGGELLTFIWLLMNHLGFGTQFYEQERQTRAKMVPRK